MTTLFDYKHESHPDDYFNAEVSTGVSIKLGVP